METIYVRLTVHLFRTAISIHYVGRGLRRAIGLRDIRSRHAGDIIIGKDAAVFESRPIESSSVAIVVKRPSDSRT